MQKKELTKCGCVNSLFDQEIGSELRREVRLEA